MSKAALLRAYSEALSELAQQARRDGVILTLETVPLEPLAMGRYAMRSEARLAREAYAPKPEQPE